MSVSAGRSVQISRIPSVDLQIHAVGIMKPLEIFEIDEGLLFRRSLVIVVDPGKY